MHIPFCRRRCHYCNFPIKVIGDSESSRLATADAYTNILVGEISHELTKCVSNGYVSPKGIDTIYFGGGTPSLLSNQSMNIDPNSYIFDLFHV